MESYTTFQWEVVAHQSREVVICVQLGVLHQYCSINFPFDPPMQCVIIIIMDIQGRQLKLIGP